MMKKLLALLMALCLGLTMFTACGNKEEGEDTKKEEKAEKEEKEESAEDEAKKVVESFMDAFVEFDMKEAAKYVDDDSFIDELGAESKDDMIDVVMDMMGEEVGEYADMFEPLAELIVDKFIDSMSYEITDTEESDDDEFTFTVELTSADFESVDFEEIFGSVLDQEASEELAMELIENGTITEDMTEEEMLAVVFEEVIKIAEDTIEDLDIETTKEEQEIVVVKDDDEWIIDAKASELE